MKSKPLIKPIIVDKEKLEELHHILRTRKLTRERRYDEIKKYVGGVCSVCEGIPTKILSYDMKGAELIERYCDECIKKWVK